MKLGKSVKETFDKVIQRYSTMKPWVIWNGWKSKAEKDKNEQIKSQNDDDLLLWPSGQSENQFYIKYLNECEKQLLKLGSPEIANTCVLHHDNAPCRCAFSVMQFLASKSIPVLLQPPYLPGMSSCDSFCNPGLTSYKRKAFRVSNNWHPKFRDKGTRSSTSRSLPWKLESELDAQEEYFEGNHINVT